MDYFGWAGRKNAPRPTREPDPPAPRRPEPPMEVSETNLTDTFVGRVKRFWESHR